MRTLPLLFVASLMGVHSFAAALEVKVPAPDFTVNVPSLPVIEMRQQPGQAAGSAPRMVGNDGTYKVEVSLSDAKKPITPRECAGSGLKAIMAQPGMPDRDNVYRAPLNPKTFLVIYLLPDGTQHMLHAHLLSSAGPTHCTDAHISRPARNGEDYDEWRKAFADARIEDTRP
ncbi:MAG TPA: hypothetical protein VFP68_20405 [Burkholderiaceae bacterium]|nr:hypothetical protein [Burkholderiaceae bacterium]